MTDKEKAKAYDKAIERAKKLYGNGIAEEIFSEPKESDDEKIKNAILNHLKIMWGNCQDDVCGVHVEDAIDWVEKQDKNSIDKIEPKFKVGDWVVRGDTIAQILDIQEQYYVGLDINGKDFVSSRFLNDDKIHLWSFQDVKDGNVLINGSNIFIFHFINNRRLMGYCHVNMDDGNLYNDIGRNECFCTIDAPITPATKEQRDILFQKIKEAGYKWNDETKTLEKLIKPKFKVGDRIRHKDTNKDDVYEISKVYCDSYGIAGYTWMIYMEYQDQYELVPNKFDSKTLKAFDKVLVRDNHYQNWTCGFFSHIVIFDDACKYNVGEILYKMCIPYNDETKHLVGTSEEAPEYYRYWED